MRKTSYLLLLALLLALQAGSPAPARAQSPEARQLLLNVEKLRQLRSILSDMKKGYKILHDGYGAIRDISEGSFRLHETFLDGLLAVNPALRRYHRVTGILASQELLLRECRDASRRLMHSGTLSPDELGYIGQVYDRLAARSLRHLEELTLVLTAGKLRMSDDERLTLIDQIYLSVSEQLEFLRRFNQQAFLLALQREREQRSLWILRHQYEE